MNNESFHICMELDLSLKKPKTLLKKNKNYLISGHKTTGSYQ